MAPSAMNSTVFGRLASRFPLHLIRLLHDIANVELHLGMLAPSPVAQLVALNLNVNAADRRRIELVLAAFFEDHVFTEEGSSTEEASFTEEGSSTEEASSSKEESSTEEEHEKSSDENSEIEANTSKECKCCYEDKPLNEFPSKTPTPTCDHQVNDCTACIKQRLRIQMSVTQWQLLMCDSCTEILPSDMIKKNTDARTFARYLNYMSTFRIRNEPGFHWCYNPECDSGQIHHATLEEPSHMICHKCGYRSCINCKVLYHRGKTCEAYQSRTTSEKDLENDASIEAIKKFTNKCPTCGVNIEKDGGCQFLCCLSCGDSFTWTDTFYDAENKQTADDKNDPDGFEQ